jgi:hypothetical protein
MFGRYFITTFLALTVAGCASVPMGDARQDAVKKTFVAKPDVAGVYIYRNESMGGAVRMDVDIDGKTIGQTAAKTYFYAELAPGTHTITSKSENTDSLGIDVVAGKLYYIWQEVKMGVLYARTKLHIVSDDEGKKGVLESQLAKTSAIDSLSSTTEAASTPSINSPVPFLTKKGQADFRDFLTKPLPRAFAISDTGIHWGAWGERPKDPSKPVDVKERALVSCKELAGKECVLYMFNNEVIYQR